MPIEVRALAKNASRRLTSNRPALYSTQMNRRWVRFAFIRVCSQPVIDRRGGTLRASPIVEVSTIWRPWIQE